MPSHKNQEDRRSYHRRYMRQRYAADADFRKRQKARAAVGHAIRDGRLSRKPCETCGSDESESHHDDYDFPLSVTWLCRPCHLLLHRGE